MRRRQFEGCTFELEAFEGVLRWAVPRGSHTSRCLAGQRDFGQTHEPLCLKYVLTTKPLFQASFYNNGTLSESNIF